MHDEHAAIIDDDDLDINNDNDNDRAANVGDDQLGQRNVAERARRHHSRRNGDPDGCGPNWWRSRFLVE